MERMVAYLTARRQIELRPAPMPRPGPGEVLIRMKAVGVCGSDVSYFVNGRTGVGEIRFPHILGHECAGLVAQVGEGVDGLLPGDRVTTEPGYYCGVCDACTSGRYNLCRHMSFMGSAVADAYGEGALTQYTLRPAHLVFRLPDNASYEDGAMLEPFSVALHAARRAGLGPGDRAAILGSGPIGASLLLVLRAIGVHSVLMTDMLPSRLAKMQALGASRVCNVEGLTFAETAALASNLDAVVDTTCAPQAVNASLHWLKKGGRLVQVGVPSGKAELDLQTLFNRGIDLKPSFRYANTYPALLSLLEAGTLSSQGLITHRFPFERTQEAFDLAASRAEGVMKIVITF